MALADLETVSRRLEGVAKKAHSGEKEAMEEVASRKVNEAPSLVGSPCSPRTYPEGSVAWPTTSVSSP